MKKKKDYCNKQTFGFTLIELLVVVAIIGIISSVVISSLSQARSKSRDARRVQEIKQIHNALALYFSDYGRYPSSGGAISPNSGWINSSDNSWNALKTDLLPYISDLPKDPKQSNDTAIWGLTGQAYSYYSTGCSNGYYMIVYRLENAKGPDNGTHHCGSSYRYGGTGADTNTKTAGSHPY